MKDSTTFYRIITRRSTPATGNRIRTKHEQVEQLAKFFFVKIMHPCLKPKMSPKSIACFHCDIHRSDSFVNFACRIHPQDMHNKIRGCPDALTLRRRLQSVLYNAYVQITASPLSLASYRSLDTHPHGRVDRGGRND